MSKDNDNPFLTLIDSYKRGKLPKRPVSKVPKPKKPRIPPDVMKQVELEVNALIAAFETTKGTLSEGGKRARAAILVIEELQVRLDALERKFFSARQRRRNSARDFTSIAKDFAHSRDETERAYAYLAEKASEELKKETPGGHNFGAWQAAATKLPEDSVTRVQSRTRTPGQ